MIIIVLLIRVLITVRIYILRLIIGPVIERIIRLDIAAVSLPLWRLIVTVTLIRIDVRRLVALRRRGVRCIGVAFWVHL